MERSVVLAERMDGGENEMCTIGIRRREVASCVTRKVCTHATIGMLSDERDRVMFEVVEFGVDRDEGWEIDGSRSALARFNVRRLERKSRRYVYLRPNLLYT